jgi:hypothetical protein
MSKVQAKGHKTRYDFYFNNEQYPTNHHFTSSIQVFNVYFTPLTQPKYISHPPSLHLQQKDTIKKSKSTTQSSQNPQHSLQRPNLTPKMKLPTTREHSLIIAIVLLLLEVILLIRLDAGMPNSHRGIEILLIALIPGVLAGIGIYNSSGFRS